MPYNNVEERSHLSYGVSWQFYDPSLKLLEPDMPTAFPFADYHS